MATAPISSDRSFTRDQDVQKRRYRFGRPLRKIGMLTLAAVATIPLLLISMGTAFAADVGTNYMMNFATWKCLDSPTGHNGQLIEEWTCNRGENQNWSPYLEYSDGTVAFYNPYYNRCLEVPGYSAVQGVRIQVNTCTGGTNQRWWKTLLGGSTYTYANRNSGECLDLKGGNPTNRTPIVQYTCSGGFNQEWIIGYNGG
jgi:hypothetical protein